MSGSTRSAKAVVSDWKASQTTMNGILYSPFVVLVVEHLAHLGGVHGRVPGHVGHEDHQRVDAVGIAAPGIGDDVVHQAVHRQRVFPGEGLVDAHRLAVVVDEQVVRVGRPAQRHAVQRRVRLHAPGPVGRLGAGRDRARERRLVAEAARAVDGAQQRSSGSPAREWSESRWSAPPGRAWRGRPPGCR